MNEITFIGDRQVRIAPAHLFFCKIRGKSRVISERTLFETHPSLLLFSEQEGYRLVSKPISKLKFQNLAIAMSFDTILLYATAP
jgi:hypothetical protein